jgi:hypothetical protein
LEDGETHNPATVWEKVCDFVYWHRCQGEMTDMVAKESLRFGVESVEKGTARYSNQLGCVIQFFGYRENSVQQGLYPAKIRKI